MIQDSLEAVLRSHLISQAAAYEKALAAASRLAEAWRRQEEAESELLQLAEILQGIGGESDLGKAVREEWQRSGRTPAAETQALSKRIADSILALQGILEEGHKECRRRQGLLQPELEKLQRAHTMRKAYAAARPTGEG